MNEVQQMENERSVAQGCGASGLRQAVGQPYWLGVDMGASSVKLAALNNVREVVFSRREAHEGAPAAVLGRLLGELDAALGLAGCAGWAMCGSASENAGDRLGAAAPQALGDVPATAAGAVGLWVAAAGPGANFLLAGVWAVRLSQTATIRGSAFWAANLLTGLFNLLPVPPLDGAQMAACAAALWRQKRGKHTQTARNDCKTGTFGVK